MFPPLERDPRYKSLDLWRGLACLMVVIDHAGVAVSGEQVDLSSGPDGLLRWLVTRAFHLALGPPMFFVISGYCIAASVDSLRRKGKSPTEFLLRRVWRTFPPYWAALLFFAAVVILLDSMGLGHLHRGPFGLALLSPRELDLSQWVGNITLTESWRPRLWGSHESTFTRIAWSLCYQEQFYVVCFLVALMAPRRLYGALGSVTLALIGFRVFAWDSGGLRRIDGLFPVFWHEFAVGLAVYWRLNVAAPRLAKQAIDAGLLGLLVLGATHPGVESAAVAAGFGLLMIGLRGWDARLAVLAPLEGVRACGRRCYSIYLVHLPVCSVGNMLLYQAGLTDFWTRTFVMVPLVSTLAVSTGWGFYHLVESRFLGLPAPIGLDRLAGVLPFRRRPAPESLAA